MMSMKGFCCMDSVKASFHRYECKLLFIFKLVIHERQIVDLIRFVAFQDDP